MESVITGGQQLFSPQLERMISVDTAKNSILSCSTVKSPVYSRT